MKFKIQTSECSQVLKQHDGKIVELAMDKVTNKPVVGLSGKTKMYALGSGAGLFLSDDQVVAC